MEILEITMKHFGKFTNQSMAFHPGINIIYGGNETGKSTMSAFIRGMFFGIEKMRGRASETDEYNLRAPWENSAFFEGTLRFESGGKIYRIERNFEKREKSAVIVCETDGTQWKADGQLPSMFLDGMSEATFSNTVFLGKTSAQTDEGLASAVRNGMLNMNLGGDARLDAARAMEELKEEKKRLEREKKQKMAEKIGALQEISMKMEYARQEMEELLKKEQELREEQKRIEGVASRQYQDALAKEQSLPQTNVPQGLGAWKIGKILMAVIAVAALAVGLVMTRWEVRMGAAVVILLSCLGVRFFGVHDEERRRQLRELELERREQRLQREYELQQEWFRQERVMAPRKQRLLANLEWLANARREKQMLLESLQEEYDACKGQQDDIEELEENLSAVYLAMDTLEEVTSEVYNAYAREINARVSAILAQITGGRYTGVFLDENFQVRVHTPEKLLSVWQVSRGTMEQIYFAVRMACAEFLNTGEPVPLVLDDAFLTYDDARLEQTLRWLSQSGRQVLLFTCHRREQEIIYSLSRENA